MRLFPPDREPDHFRRAEAQAWLLPSRPIEPSEEVVAATSEAFAFVESYFSGQVVPSIETQNSKAEVLALYTSSLADMVGKVITALSLAISPVRDPLEQRGDEDRTEFFERVGPTAERYTGLSKEERLLLAMNDRRVYLPTLVPPVDMPLADTPMDAGVWPEEAVDTFTGDGPE